MAFSPIPDAGTVQSFGQAENVNLEPQPMVWILNHHLAWGVY